MNQVTLIGRLTRDPELKTVNDKAVANFTLAVDREFKNAEGKRDADFIDCAAWRKLAGIVRDHLAKGQRVGITGRLQVRSYDAQDGTRRKATTVIADRVEFLDRKPNGNGKAAEGEAAATAETFAAAADNGADVPF